MFVRGGGGEPKSTGPWMDAVEVRWGVDENCDETVDVWTKWKTVRECYGRIDGFTKIFSVTVAELDLTLLTAGFGIPFMFRTNDSAAIIERVVVRSNEIED